MLKSAKHNKKLGGKIKVKHWKDMPLYQLTLEERQTCPDYCEQWDNCYGNNMPFAHRFDHTHPKFLEMLEFNIGRLASIHPQGFVVRLHVLGDFYSQEYVNFWDDRISEHKELNIYGYTHHHPSSDIGRAIARLNRIAPLRFRVRYSDAPGERFSTHVVRSAEDVTDKNMIICPEQLGKTESCSTCGLCWTAPDKKIAFIEH